MYVLKFVDFRSFWCLCLNLTPILHLLGNMFYNQRRKKITSLLNKNELIEEKIDNLWLNWIFPSPVKMALKLTGAMRILATVWKKLDKFPIKKWTIPSFIRLFRAVFFLLKISFCGTIRLKSFSKPKPIHDQPITIIWSSYKEVI